MIKNKTVYTKENFLEFQKYHYFHHMKIARILFSLFGILLLMISISGFLYEDYVFAIVELILGSFLLLEFNTSLMPILQAKHILKSDSMLIGMENMILFHEEFIEVTNPRSTSKIPYEELYCFSEHQDFFYIYLNKISAILIDKKGMIEGTIEELSQLLKENIKRK